MVTTGIVATVSDDSTTMEQAALLWVVTDMISKNSQDLWIGFSVDYAAAS